MPNLNPGDNNPSPGATRQQPAPTPAPPPSVIDIITKVAKSLGLPPELALAIAYHESGLNPYAVGDNGTSFGLYQLHEGGELGSHTAAWAHDVYNNALTALTVVKKVYDQNPSADWGQIAAQAQRPQDPASYAASIDSILTDSGSNADWFSQQVNAASQPYTPQVSQHFQQTVGQAPSSNGQAGLTAQLTQQQLAAGLSQDGFVIGLIDHTPELKNIFQEALQKNWSIQETMVALQNSHWYQTHSQAQQQYAEMQYSSPKQLQRKVQQTANDLSQMAHSLGVTIDPKALEGIATNVVKNGLDQTEQVAALVKGFKYNGQGNLLGQSGSDVDTLKQLASEYAVGVTNQQVQSMVQRMLTGNLSPDDVLNFFKTQALSKFPQLKQQFDQGLTVADVASPYKQEMAKLWNDDPNTASNIPTENPTIMKALQQNTPKGAQLMPIWQFQQMLKQDPRWLKTTNARDSLMDSTTSLLQNMGLISGGVNVGSLGSSANG